MKIAKYIPAAALALVLAGCQSEDDFISSDYANDPMAVHIRAGIEALQTRVNTTGTGDAWEEGDLISVANASENAVTGKDKAIYEYSNGAWSPAGTDYIVWADDVNTFEAYYPVVGGKTDSYTQFELPTNQNSSDPDDDNYIGHADYMTATKEQSKGGALDLTFEHHLAKVTVKISGYGDQYATQKPTFKDPTFTIPTTKTPVDGKTLTVANSGTTVTGLFSEDASAEAKHSFTAVLLPGNYAADDTFVQLNMEDGTTLTVLANVQQLTTSGGLVSGKAYTFNVTVGKNGATINSVTVENWGNGWEESGTADEETGPKVNADTHTISLSDVGQLNAELIGQALNGETTNVTLTISGPMNENDIAALKKYMTDNTNATLSLDLTDAILASIPDKAFYQIEGLVSIELPEGLTKIGTLVNGRVFSGCTGLESVKFPSTLEEIAYSSFFGCTSLKTIDLSKTKVASIEAALFNGCSSLTSVSFGPKTSVFRNTVFEGCSSLTTIDLSLCEAVPALNYNYDFDDESPFYNLEKSEITIYVKDADMKTKFEGSDWVTQVGFTADNFEVKNNQ